MRGLARAIPIFAGLSAALGCAPAFDGSVYRGKGFAFRVPERPPEWQGVSVSHAALAYEDGASGGTVLVNARCDRDGEDVPLASLTQHLFIRFTDRSIHEQKVEPFDGREAMRTDVTAKLDGVPRRFLVYVLKKDRCVYDLLYLAPPEDFQAGAARFDAWARSFTALPREVSP